MLIVLHNFFCEVSIQTFCLLFELFANLLKLAKKEGIKLAKKSNTPTPQSVAEVGKFLKVTKDEDWVW